MKRLKAMWLSLVVAAGAAGFAVSPASVVAGDVIVHIGIGAPAPAPTVYSYTYYPDSEVYFVPETGVYWWSVGGQWSSGPRAPSNIVLGDSVKLRVDAPEPWRHHDVIVRQYPHRHHDH
jgi:hypothetical protein